MMDELPVHPSNNPMLVGGRIGASGEQLYSNLYGKEMEMMRKMMNLDESEMQNHHQMMKYGQPMTGMPRNYPPNIPPGMLTDVEMKHLTSMGGGGGNFCGGSRFPYPNQQQQQPSMNFGYDNKMVGGNKFEGLLRPCYDMVRHNGGPRGFPMAQSYSSSPIPTFDSPATQIPNNTFICDPPHFSNDGSNINKNPNCGVVIKTENNLNCGGNIANNLISSDFHNNNNNNNNTTGNNELITTTNNKCSDELFAKSTTTSSTNLLIANNNSHSNTNSINNSNMNNMNNNINNNNSCTNNKNEPNTYNLNRNVNDNNSKINKTTSLRNFHRGKCMDGEDEENSIGDTATADGCDEDLKPPAMLDNDSNEEYTDL